MTIHKTITGRSRSRLEPDIQDLSRPHKPITDTIIDINFASIEARVLTYYLKEIHMTTLQQFKNDMAKHLYGITVAEAHEKGICISCKQEVGDTNIHTLSGQKEYKISGLCEDCWDKIFA